MRNMHTKTFYTPKQTNMKQANTQNKCSFYQMIKGIITLGVLVCATIGTHAQTVLLNPSGVGGFESGTTFPLNGWTAVNGSNNKWYVGSVQVPSAGTYGAYIDKTILVAPEGIATSR